MGTGKPLSWIAAAVAVALLLAVLASSAAADPVAAGHTRLQLDSRLFLSLRQQDVAIKALKGGRANGLAVGLPVRGGLIDLGTASGFVTHESGFRLLRGRRSVSISRLALDTGKREVRAKIDGRRLRLARIPRYVSTREGFGDKVEVARLPLSAAAAAALNQGLRLRAFRAGTSFGGATTTIRPEWDTVSGGTMEFGLDPAFVDKLRSVGVEPLPFEVAAGPTPFSYSGAVLSGAIYPSLKAGGGGIEGGIRVADPNGPSPVVTWSDFAFDLETSKLAAAALAHTEAGQLAPTAGGPLAALDLSGSTARIDPQARTVTIVNARATLEAGAAALLDETFAKPKGMAGLFAAGDPLGYFSLALTGR